MGTSVGVGQYNNSSFHQLPEWCWIKVLKKSLLLFSWAIQHQVTLSAVQCADVDNVQMDFSSWDRSTVHEGMLNKKVVHEIYWIWYLHINLHIDLYFLFESLVADGSASDFIFRRSSTMCYFRPDYSGTCTSFLPYHSCIKIYWQTRTVGVEEEIIIASAWTRRDWYVL